MGGVTFRYSLIFWAKRHNRWDLRYVTDPVLDLIQYGAAIYEDERFQALKGFHQRGLDCFPKRKKVARREFLAALFKKPNKPLSLEQGGN